MGSLLLKAAGSYFVDRLQEPSTWAAIAAAIAGATQVSFNGDFKGAFIAFGLAGATLLGVFLKEGYKE
jgi:hypothetical protein